VADGNFKADHVRQKNESDVWLSDGSGMIPQKQEYLSFLATAIERLTVSRNFIGVRLFHNPVPALIPAPLNRHLIIFLFFLIEGTL
jgi:hypothetical protein